MVTDSQFSISRSLLIWLSWASALIVSWRRFLSRSQMTSSLIHPDSHIFVLVLLGFPAAFAKLNSPFYLNTCLCPLSWPHPHGFCYHSGCALSMFSFNFSPCIRFPTDYFRALFWVPFSYVTEHGVLISFQI